MIAGDTLLVEVDKTGVAPVLVVKTLAGARAGSLTMSGYLAMIGCIDRGHNYEATVMTITGAIYDVRVTRI